MKKIILAVIDIALVAAFFLAPANMPFGLNAMNARKAQVSKTESYDSSYQQKLTVAESSIASVVNDYNETREFDVYYGDLENISRVFSGIAGISVRNIVEVLPMEDFREGNYIDTSAKVAAVKYELVVDDVMTALSVIERMQVPLYSLYVSYPNTMYVTFLTGGDL